MKSLLSGFALSLTVALFYTSCTMLAVFFPDQFMGFMRALFHGLDFAKLVTGDPYRWSSFCYALLVMSAWAFAVGSFFSWLNGFFGQFKNGRVVKRGEVA